MSITLEFNNHLYDVSCPNCKASFDVHSTTGGVEPGDHKVDCPQCGAHLLITIYVDYLAEVRHS